MTNQVIAALKDFIAASQGDVKAAGVEALVPLADPGLLKFFADLLVPIKTPSTRRAALRGLEQLGDPHVGDIVIGVVSNDKDASVRLAALDTLGRIGSFKYHDTLLKLTRPAEEPDASVRSLAWEVFQQLLRASASDEQLRDYAELFRKAANAAQDQRDRDQEMSHRLAVLLVQADRDQNDPKKKGDPAALADLAAQRENIGDAYVHLHQPEQAIHYFRDAFNYWLQNNAQAVETQSLIRELMLAYLDSKQYGEAAKFADETIARSPEQQRIVAPLLVNRAQDLLDPPGPPGQPKPPPFPRDALQLATEGLTKINQVALEKNYRERLHDYQVRAAAMMAAGTSRPSH